MSSLGFRVPNKATLLELVKSKTGVIVVTSAAGTGLRMISSIILTRLLTPDAFGIVGIIGSIFFVITMLTDLGFQSFLVPHERGDDRRFRDILWTIHAARGLILTFVAVLAAPAFGWILNKPEIALPLAVASITFAFNGLASFSLITALRHHQARKLAVLDLMLQVGQTVTCIALALWWRNVWAMVAAMIVQSALRMLLSFTWFTNSRHKIAHDKDVHKEFLRFSRLILATGMITLIIMQTDKLVLGRIFSLQEFGLYAIALSLSSAPMIIGDSYMTRVVFPLYAQTWRNTPDTLANIYYTIHRRVSLLFALGCGVLIGGSRFLILLLYDPRYEGAALWLSLLMLGVALRLPNVAASQLMTAKGDIRDTLNGNLVRLAWYIGAIPFGFWAFGALGVVIAVSVVEIPAALYNWRYLKKGELLNLRQEFLFIALIALGAAVSYGLTTVALTTLRVGL